MADQDAAPEEGKAPKPKTKLSPQLMLAVGNSLLVLAALGVTVYTKLLFKRPTITESKEIEIIQEDAKKSTEPVERPIVKFDVLRTNIAMTSGKAHYITIEFGAECRDQRTADLLAAKKDQATDTLIGILGRKQMTELNTVQGKLLLKTRLLQEFGTLTTPGSIVDIYFSSFVLQ